MAHKTALKVSVLGDLAKPVVILEKQAGGMSMKVHRHRSISMVGGEGHSTWSRGRKSPSGVHRPQSLGRGITEVEASLSTLK